VKLCLVRNLRETYSQRCVAFYSGIRATVARALSARGYSVCLGCGIMVCAAWLDHSSMVRDWRGEIYSIDLAINLAIK